ncbi:MAG: hypothetical protein AAF752_10140 [Bacteroidota bacterium]
MCSWRLLIVSLLWILLLPAAHAQLQNEAVVRAWAEAEGNVQVSETDSTLTIEFIQPNLVEVPSADDFVYAGPLPAPSPVRRPVVANVGLDERALVRARGDGTFEIEWEDPNRTDISRLYRSMGFFFLAGAANGVMDTIRSSTRYDNSILSDLPNQDFWDYRLSTDNKYKNGDPAQGEAFLGSTTVFVGATDGWHAAQTVMLGSFTAGTLLYRSSGPRWYHKALDLVLVRAAYGAGFSLMFNSVLPK